MNGTSVQYKLISSDETKEIYTIEYEVGRGRGDCPYPVGRGGLCTSCGEGGTAHILWKPHNKHDMIEVYTE